MSYQGATGKRVFLFSLGTVFADTPEEAEAVATDAGIWNRRPDGTWGTSATDAHAELCKDMIATLRGL